MIFYDRLNLQLHLFSLDGEKNKFELLLRQLTLTY